MISSGQRIGNFVILDELGRGGYGTVYLAREAHSEKRVAIKFLHPRLLRTDESKGSFLNEMINQAKLSLNPNIVSVIQSLTFADSQGEHLGMVMEYVDGEPLDLFIQRYGLLPAFVAVPIFIQVLNGLDLAHRHGILHRDIKPGNIMVGRDGTVKIMDFGLSKALGGTPGASESARAASLNYTAPERLKKLTVDARTDIYSIGVTMYEALTGRPPYDIEPGDWAVAIREHENGRCPGIRQAYSPHGEDIERIVRKAMNPSPSDRYQNGQELMVELLEVFKVTPFPEKSEPVFGLIREKAIKISGIRPPIEMDSPRSREIPPLPQMTIVPPKLAPQESPPRRTPDLDLLPSQPSLRKSSMEARKGFYKFHKDNPEPEEHKLLGILLGVVLIVILGIILILAALWITGKSDYKDWEEALKTSSISSFRTYLVLRPNGRYRAEAQAKIAEIRLQIEREARAKNEQEELKTAEAKSATNKAKTKPPQVAKSKPSPSPQDSALQARKESEFRAALQSASDAELSGDIEGALAYINRAKKLSYPPELRAYETRLLDRLPVRNLRILLYEGPSSGVANEYRIYATSFKKRPYQQVIWAEVSFDNLYRGNVQHTYHISLEWHYPELRSTVTDEINIVASPDSNEVECTRGRGYAGRSQRCTLKVFIDGKSVGLKDFEIID